MKVPRIKRHPRTWVEVLSPHTKRFKMAAAFNSRVEFNSRGCQSMHDLLMLMAERLDWAAELERDVLTTEGNEGLINLQVKVLRHMKKSAEKADSP